MTYSEQRKFSRSDTLNFLAYSCMNEKDGSNTQQGIGRTLNISEGGVLLETDTPLESAQTIFLTIALKEKVIDVKGKVLWCKKSAGGNFMSGIEFYGMEQDAFPILNRYLESFYKEPPK
jgi:Tfp pilus assembly protein PilZ